MSQRRIAGPEDRIRTEVDVDLRFEGLLDIDPTNDAKDFSLQRRLGADDGVIKGNLQLGGNVVGHRLSFQFAELGFSSRSDGGHKPKVVPIKWSNLYTCNVRADGRRIGG